jgi:DNA-binding response OmpR family regulator
MNILLIEPDKSLSQTYQMYLRQQGYNCVTCNDAQHAITACDSTRPDVVVLELLLGSHNGVEFLYEFRSYPEWQNIPVVLLSMLAPHELQIYRNSLEQLQVAQTLYKPTTTLEQLEYAITSAAQAFQNI